MTDIFNIILNVILGLLVLTVLVVAHEFGHFLVGRKCGIRVLEFSAGFGPKLISKIKNGIRYSLRALPLGGFVSFLGEDEDIPDDPAAFNNRPKWQRLVTLLAGPLANILVALVLTIGVLTIFGDATPVVYKVDSGSNAEAAGLMPGDRIVEVNGKRIDFSMEFSSSVLLAGDDFVDIGVERDGSTIRKTVALSEKADGYKYMGISIVNERRQFGFFEAIGLSFKWMYLIIEQTFVSLGRIIFAGKGAADMAGPIGISTLVGNAVRTGPEIFMRIAALISISLGIMNLLPFPALDGGRVVLLGVEAVRKKPLPRDKEGYINFAGLIILFGLMIFVTYNDIVRLISGG